MVTLTTHIQRTPQTSPLVVAAAALATCGVYLVIDYLRRQQASSAMLPSCSAVDYPILPLRSASGAEGLEFRCEAFARELLVLNGGGQPAAALTSQSVSPLSRPLPAHVPSQPWRATPPTPPPAPAVRLAPIPLAPAPLPQTSTRGGTVLIPQHQEVPAAPARIEVAPQPAPIPVAVRVQQPHARRGVLQVSRGSPVVWLGEGDAVEVAGRVLRDPMTYIGFADRNPDPSAILVSLPADILCPSRSLPYWPSYANAEPWQRARYLDWMAGGRAGPINEIGFVFIFFYGLERRALIEQLDHALVEKEVRRLLTLYGSNNSFRGYASDFLAHLSAERLPTMRNDEVCAALDPMIETSRMALEMLAAWYCIQAKPIPARYAMAVASRAETARRGAAAKEARDELASLFAGRYSEKFGEGVIPKAARAQLKLEYRPASAALSRSGRSFVGKLPDVLGRAQQFDDVVALWNTCIEDLKRYASAKRKTDEGGELTTAMWEALPPELRDRHEHPLAPRWQEAIGAVPGQNGFHMLPLRQLAETSGMGDRDKYTPAQMRKLAETAEPLGYSIEPDGRVTGKGADGNASVVIWRSAYSGPPDAASYASLAAITSLGMAVVTADGVVEHTEIETVVRFIEDMFNLDEPMRERFEALRYRLIHEPAKLTGLMKRLAATRTQEQVKILGKFLVAIAAADGTIAEAEHRTLRTLFRGMGLSAAVLDETIVAVGVRLEGDQPIVVDQGSAGRPGEAIPRPPGAFRLDQSAIAALIEETEQVRGMLAEVFAGEEDEAPAPSIASRPSAAEPVAPGAEYSEQPAERPIRHGSVSLRASHHVDQPEHGALRR